MALATCGFALAPCQVPRRLRVWCPRPILLPKADKTVILHNRSQRKAPVMNEGDKETAPTVTETTTTASGVLMETTVTPTPGGPVVETTRTEDTPELRETTVKEQ